MQTKKLKVFGIGLSKTGTSSLARALDILGYKTRDNLGVTKYDAGDLSCIDKNVLDANDAFTDTPIPSFYRELDASYPNAKFILTTRDRGAWLKSCKMQFTKRLADKHVDAQRRLFMDLYDCNVYEDEKFSRGYETFVNGVLEYFKHRSQDLLVLDIGSGDGWEELCPFLGEPIPAIPFPRANVTQIRWMKADDIVAIVQEAGQEALSAYRLIQGESFRLNKSRVGLFTTFSYLLDGLVSRLKDNGGGASKAATKASQHIIVKRLKRNTPKIPIISPETRNDPTYSVRRNWNHFWLVSSINEENKQCGSESAFTLSLALIEDHVPILGVVYAPEIKTTYYAMAGKGAFKLTDGKKPEALGLRVAGSGSVAQAHGKTDISHLAEGNNKCTTESTTLAMCLAAEGQCSLNRFLSDSTEWQTAAANVVLDAVGIRVVDCESKKALTYNKENFANGCIEFV